VIISHTYKCIFIAIPKTATHAIRFAMRPYLGKDDTEQVNLFVQKKIPIEGFQHINHGHIKAKEAAPILSDIWNSYFKFAIVRNPFERFISYCAFLYSEQEEFHKNPENFLYHTLYNSKSKNHILFQPQSQFLFDENNKLLVDYVGRFENLQESYETICKNTGIPSSELIKINTSHHHFYRTYYNAELIEMVSEIYQEDIANFQYKF
jgi:hypothetical protein